MEKPSQRKKKSSDKKYKDRHTKVDVTKEMSGSISRDNTLPHDVEEFSEMPGDRDSNEDSEFLPDSIEVIARKETNGVISLIGDPFDTTLSDLNESSFRKNDEEVKLNVNTGRGDIELYADGSFIHWKNQSRGGDTKKNRESFRGNIEEKNYKIGDNIDIGPAATFISEEIKDKSDEMMVNREERNEKEGSTGD